MGGTYGSHREESGAYRGFFGGWVESEEGDILEDLGVDGRIILKCVFRI